MVPAEGVEFGGQRCVDVDDAGVCAPGAAEADGVVCRGRTLCAGGCGIHGWCCGFQAAGDVAIDDDVAGGLIGGGARLGGDEAGAVGVKFVALEDRGGVTEDVVDAAFDVGVDVVLAAVVGEQRVLMPEEAAVLEDAAVATVGHGDGLAGVPSGVLEGDVVRFEAGGVDLDGFSEEGAAGDAGIEGVSDDDFRRRFAEADEGDVVVILGDDDALVIDAGDDLDEDAAGRAVGVGRGEGVVVERVDDGGEGNEILVAGRGHAGRGIDADVDVGGDGGKGEQESGAGEAIHADEITAMFAKCAMGSERAQSGRRGW